MSYNSDELQRKIYTIDIKRRDSIVDFQINLSKLIDSYEEILPGNKWKNLNSTFMNNWPLNARGLNVNTEERQKHFLMPKNILPRTKKSSRFRGSPTQQEAFLTDLESFHILFNNAFDADYVERKVYSREDEQNMPAWAYTETSKAEGYLSGKQELIFYNLLNTLKIFHPDFSISENDYKIMNDSLNKNFDLNIPIHMPMHTAFFDRKFDNIGIQRRYLRFFDNLIRTAATYPSGPKINIINIINLIKYYFRDKIIILISPVYMEHPLLRSVNLGFMNEFGFNSTTTRAYSGSDKIQQAPETERLKTMIKNKDRIINYVNRKIYFGRSDFSANDIPPKFMFLQDIRPIEDDETEEKMAKHISSKTIIEKIKFIGNLKNEDILPIEIRFVQSLSEKDQIPLNKIIEEESSDKNNIPILRFDLIPFQQTREPELEYFDSVYIRNQDLMIYEYFLPILKVLMDLSPYTKYSMSSTNFKPSRIKEITRKYLMEIHGKEVVENSKKYSDHYNLAISCLRKSNFISKDDIVLEKTGLEKLLQFSKDSRKNVLQIKHTNNRTIYEMNYKDGYRLEKGPIKSKAKAALHKQFLFWLNKFEEISKYISINDAEKKIPEFNEKKYYEINKSLKWLNSIND